jgi:hypothetical protein
MRRDRDSNGSNFLREHFLREHKDGEESSRFLPFSFFAQARGLLRDGAPMDYSVRICHIEGVQGQGGR